MILIFFFEQNVYQQHKAELFMVLKVFTTQKNMAISQTIVEAQKASL